MKKNVYIRITKSLCSTAEMITTLQNNYISIKVFKCSHLPAGEVLPGRSFRAGKGGIREGHPSAKKHSCTVKRPEEPSRK